MRTILRIALAAVAVTALLASALPAQATDERSGTRLGGPVVPGVKPRFWGASASVLDYHGGPVMRTNTTFAIYWSPSGSTWQRGYMDAIGGYFSDVAADSGSGDNVYSTETQYFDTTGHIGYRSNVAGSYVDSAAFPKNGCPAYGGFDVCLTDAQIIAEVHRVTRTLHLPEDGTHAYFLFLPKSTGNCFDADGSVCAFTYYCAYHWFDRSLLYATMPYAATDFAACGLAGPNGDAADATINVTSHEHREMINDPYGDAWWDNKGYEGSDKCAWTFGAPLGSTAAGPYNQVINGHRYLLQREWSNATKRCVQRGV
jgi:hypothetical protein